MISSMFLTAALLASNTSPTVFKLGPGTIVAENRAEIPKIDTACRQKSQLNSRKKADRANKRNAMNELRYRTCFRSQLKGGEFVLFGR